MDLSATLRRLRRAPLVLAHLLTGAVLAAGQRLLHGPGWHRRKQGRALMHSWHQRCRRLIGLEVTVNGTPGHDGTLLVANHVSWMDIVALASHTPACFLAKAEVRSWPLIGSLATLTGTLFVRRHSMSVLTRTIDHLGVLLQAGQSVALFPEGTTGTGEVIGKFHSGLLQAAIDAQRPVQPVALSYVRGGELDELAPFVGDQGFLGHLWRMLGAPQTEVLVDFCEPLATAGADRRQLAVEARRCIVARTRLRQLAAVARRPEPVVAADAA